MRLPISRFRILANTNELLLIRGYACEDELLRILLTDKQLERLREIRQQQLADWREGRPQIVDDLFITDDLVQLMSGMGRACYLGLDGRVWVGNLAEGEPPQVLDDPKAVASCIVRWSGVIGMEDLIDALPKMPEGAETCSMCKGTREMSKDWGQPEEHGFRYYCRRCGGLGWTMA